MMRQSLYRDNVVVVSSLSAAAAAYAMTVRNIWHWAHEHVQWMPKQTLLQILFLWIMFIPQSRRAKGALRAWTNYSLIYSIRGTESVELNSLEPIGMPSKNRSAKVEKNYFCQAFQRLLIFWNTEKTYIQTLYRTINIIQQAKTTHTFLVFSVCRCPTFVESNRVRHTALRCLHKNTRSRSSCSAFAVLTAFAFTSIYVRRRSRYLWFRLCFILFLVRVFISSLFFISLCVDHSLQMTRPFK